MVQFDKSIHPVALYEYYLICISMNIHENLKNEGQYVKTMLPGDGLRYDLSCTPRAFKIHAKLFSGTLKYTPLFSPIFLFISTVLIKIIYYSC